MRVQRNLPPLGGQVAEPVAALQHGFSKAAVQNGLTGRIPNRTFAVPVPDVSHADQADLGLRETNGRYMLTAIAAKSSMGGLRTFAAIANLKGARS